MFIHLELTKTKDGANSTIGCPSYGRNCPEKDLERGHISK